MKSLSFAVVLSVLVSCSAAQAQQRSLFGNRGPMAGPNGFATGSMGASPAVQGRSTGTTIRYQPGNSYAPTGMFDRRAGSTFGPSGLGGSFSRQQIGSTEFGLSFNRGLAGDENVPRLMNGLPEETISVTGPTFPTVTPPPTLPIVFPPPPEFPVEIPAATVPVDVPVGPITAEASATAPATPRSIRPGLRATEPTRQVERPRSRIVARQSRKLSRQEKFRDVTIGLEDGVWTLRGAVDSFEARDLAEAFAALEPGVGEVRNEITVRGADVAPSE